MKYLLCFLLIGCSSLKKKPVEYSKLSELKCNQSQNRMFLTKMDLLHCLAEKVDTQLHKVTLSFSDLPKTGPMADLTFFALTHGYITAKSINVMGAEDYVTQAEFNQFLLVYKKNH